MSRIKFNKYDHELYGRISLDADTNQWASLLSKYIRGNFNSAFLRCDTINIQKRNSLHYKLLKLARKWLETDKSRGQEMASQCFAYSMIAACTLEYYNKWRKLFTSLSPKRELPINATDMFQYIRHYDQDIYEAWVGKAITLKQLFGIENAHAIIGDCLDCARNVIRDNETAWLFLAADWFYLSCHNHNDINTRTYKDNFNTYINRAFRFDMRDELNVPDVLLNKATRFLKLQFKDVHSGKDYTLLWEKDIVTMTLSIVLEKYNRAIVDGATAAILIEYARCFNSSMFRSRNLSENVINILENAEILAIRNNDNAQIWFNIAEEWSKLSLRPTEVDRCLIAATNLLAGEGAAVLAEQIRTKRQWLQIVYDKYRN